MPSLRSLLRAGGHSLANHIDHLHLTRETLGERLRETVAQAVGQTVAGAVREAVHAVLADAPLPLTMNDRFGQRPDPSRPLWDEPDRDRWDGTPEGRPWSHDPHGLPPQEEDDFP